MRLVHSKIASDVKIKHERNVFEIRDKYNLDFDICPDGAIISLYNGVFIKLIRNG